MAAREVWEFARDAIDDLVADLLFYDRKDDEEFGIGAIESAVDAGQITEEQMVATFAEALHRGITEGR